MAKRPAASIRAEIQRLAGERSPDGRTNLEALLALRATQRRKGRPKAANAARELGITLPRGVV